MDPKKIVAGAAIAGLSSYRMLQKGPFASWSNVILGLDDHATVSGFVEPGFEPVLKAFAENFAKGQEIGAQFTAYVNGKLVVDLVGGHTSLKRDQDMARDNLSVIFSSGKCVTGIVIAYLVGKGLLSYNMRIADVWPEFAQGHKGNVLLKDLMEHRAGLAWLDYKRRPTIDELLDLDTLAKKIADQPHSNGGVPVQSYHAVTRGWYLNEIVRRVTGGKTIGRVLREEIAPLIEKKTGEPLDVYIGLDPVSWPRYVPVVEMSRFRVLQRILMPKSINPDPMQFPAFKSQLWSPTSPTHKSTLASGPKGEKGETLLQMINTLEVVQAEGSSYATVANASSLAKLAAIMAGSGEWNGVKLMDKQTFQEANTVDEDIGVDEVLRFPYKITKGGWMKNENCMVAVAPVPSSRRRIGWNWTGWSGYGGSQLYWDSGHQVAFAYVPCGLQVGIMGDTRSERITIALVQCVERLNSMWAYDSEVKPVVSKL